jgi:hypothetical protein
MEQKRLKEDLEPEIKVSKEYQKYSNMKEYKKQN